MKTTQEYLNDLSRLSDLLGYDLSKCEQGSDEWLHAKLGVISGSRVYDVFKKGRGKSGYSASRDTYMKELVAQIITKEQKQINAKSLEWGKMNEIKGRSSFEFENNVVIEEIPFIFKELKLDGVALPNMRCGVSIDGRIRGESKGIEIKAPYNTTVFLDFVLDEKVKPEYVWQCHFGMWVTGAKSWAFVNFDPRCEGKMFHGVEVERDEEAMAILDVEIPKFILEMDEMLKKLNLTFGDQWLKKAA